MKESAESRAPDVTLVVLDTLRGDMLSDPSRMAQLPNFQRLATQSYVFRRAYAPSHWTIPSHASMFTGVLPSVHGAHVGHLDLDGELPTLAEIFAQNGYATACATANPNVSHFFELTRGFEKYRFREYAAYLLLTRALETLSRGPEGPPGPRHLIQEMADAMESLVKSSPLWDNGAKASTSFLVHAQRSERRPRFNFLNLMEAHIPHHARGSFRSVEERVRYRQVFSRYDEFAASVMSGRVTLTPEIRQVLAEIYWDNAAILDQCLGRVLDALRLASPDQGYLVVVSDHGHLLGEKGKMDHTAGLDEALIRVPLLIRPPGGASGVPIEEPVSISWLFYLLRDLATGQADALTRWLAWARGRGHLYSESHGGLVGPNPLTGPAATRNPALRRDLLQFWVRYRDPAVAYVDSRWKLVCHMGAGSDELYDLESDPGESMNLTTQRRDLVDEIHRTMKEHYLNAPVTGNTSSTARRDLLPLEAKRVISEAVLDEAFGREGNGALLWTAGKDSTLVLYLALAVARRSGRHVPPVVLVDHGQHFPETWTLVHDVVAKEGLRLLVARNEDMLSAATPGVDTVPLEDLDAEDQEEALKMGLQGTAVPLSLNTEVGNHLMKTVALNRLLRREKIDTVITGIRWDENPARASEVFFSPRDSPRHVRVHPILPWTERDVWS